ncbi:MAG TPA: STAS domain-containing protein, partial [Bryobacteraceae bacterium]|nr:STAS domain-containing protein [Bryobacteraceae bacterium]
SLEIGQKEIRPGVVVVTLAGRVMLGSESAEIEALIEKGIKEGRKHFVFDLAGVTHIDSTGIGRFISGLNKVRLAGGNLCMAAASGQVRDAFRVTRLDTVFKFYAGAEEALQSLG